MLKKGVFLLILNFIFIETYAMTADSAQKKCRKYLAETIASEDHSSNKEMKKIEDLIIILLNKTESVDPQSLPQLLYDCMSGVDALKWLRDHSELNDLKENSDLISYPPNTENKS